MESLDLSTGEGGAGEVRVVNEETKQLLLRSITSNTLVSILNIHLFIN